MTTKQEIIDYIDSNILIEGNEYYNYPVCDELIQMIKYLKPEIEVGKLPWVEDSYGDGFITPITKRFHIHKCLNMFKIEIDGAVYRELFTLEEAQDHVQQLWGEYVLSLLEVE